MKAKSVFREKKKFLFDCELSPAKMELLGLHHLKINLFTPEFMMWTPPSLDLDIIHCCKSNQYVSKTQK